MLAGSSEMDTERLRRWRLLLGGRENDGIGFFLDDASTGIDRAVSALYEGELAKSATRQGGMESSAPKLATWLGDIRTYFPSSVVKVMQQDALSRFNLKQLLLEPELLAATEPDVHLVATLLALKNLIPEKTRSTAREVVGKVVAEIMRKLATQMRQAVVGSLSRAVRNYRPHHNEIDWNRTIKANLKHYQPQYKTIIPERRIGFGRRRSSLRDIILCLDQSGSMATSVVYAGVFGAVLASLPSVSTRLVVFDTSVVDLTADLQDPIDLLFGVQLGGGTDINRALNYCHTLVVRPNETVLVLISDLFEGGNRQEMLTRASMLVTSGVQIIALLTLSDDGAPSYDHNIAEQFASMGIPAFACTPDLFPDLIAAAIEKKDIGQWAAGNEIPATRSNSPHD
jgi:Mg-chelatase subunit ChlD